MASDTASRGPYPFTLMTPSSDATAPRAIRVLECTATTRSDDPVLAAMKSRRRFLFWFLVLIPLLGIARCGYLRSGRVFVSVHAESLATFARDLLSSSPSNAVVLEFRLVPRGVPTDNVTFRTHDPKLYRRICWFCRVTGIQEVTFTPARSRVEFAHYKPTSWWVYAVDLHKLDDGRSVDESITWQHW